MTVDGWLRLWEKQVVPVLPFRGPKRWLTALLSMAAVFACGGGDELQLSAQVVRYRGDEARGDGDAVQVRAWLSNPDRGRVTDVRVQSLHPLSASGDTAWYEPRLFPVGTSEWRAEARGEITSAFGRREKTWSQTIRVQRTALPPAFAMAGCSARTPVCLTAATPTFEGAFELRALAPPGTGVRIGKGEYQSDASGIMQATATLADFLLQAPIGAVESVPMRITSPDGVAANVTLAIDSATWPLALLQRVTEGHGVILPGEQAEGASSTSPTFIRGRTRAVAWLDRAGHWHSYGQGNLAELGLVARESVLPARKQSCGLFGNPKKTRDVVHVHTMARDSRVSVYERRTGRVREHITVPAPFPPCPKTLSADFAGVYNFAPAEAVRAVMKSFVPEE